MNRFYANTFETPDEHAVHLRERLVKLLNGEDSDETPMHVEEDGDFELQ